MKNLSKNFDWKKSPSHINFLVRYFIGPNDIEKVMSHDYLSTELKERPKTAIQRFIQDNYLVPCELQESLHHIFTSNDLKKILKEKGIKQSGVKPELVDRLINYDRPMVQELVSNYKIMKCSYDALNFINQFRGDREKSLNLSKKNSFEFLLKSDVKNAYRELLKYKRKYIDANFEASDLQIEQMSFVISSSPKVLGNIGQTDLDNLRAATCMSFLWIDELSESWLSDSFKTNLISNTIAINYLKCNAEIRKDLARCQEYTDKVKIIFDKNDFNSCELCTKFNNQIFDLKNFPELPLENCTSQTGCKCEIEEIYDEEDKVECENVLGVLTEVGKLELFTKLSQLKKMLDNNLITQEEYQQKKTEILSRF